MPYSKASCSQESIPPTRKRKSTGKRLRFEIFKRDHFTCQYCGAQPPDVVLVVDHITPVAAGGSDDPDNLITACETCNQGKADKPLSHRIVRVDADELYLQTVQEATELERYQRALVRKKELIEVVASELEEQWLVYAPPCYATPKWLNSTLRQLLSLYDPLTVERALINVAAKADGGYLGYGQSTARYLTAVVRNMAAEAGEDDS